MNMAVNRMVELLVVLVISPAFVSGKGLVKEAAWRHSDRQMQLNDVVLDVGDSLQWEGLGCYNDKKPRALRDFLGKSSGKTPQDIIKDCAEKAVDKGHVYFGIQYKSECWSDKEGPDRYKMYGKASNCAHGIGSDWSNYVYNITKVEGYCVTHYQLYVHNSPVTEDPCETCKCESSGHVYCHHRKCPLLPLKCKRKVTRPGECCPICECYHQGIQHKDGDTWWWPISDKGCEQCSCSSSQAVCKIQICPVCNLYVDRQPGQCCRACATEAPITFTIKPTTELVMTLPTPPSP